jgi:hypothetical protein
MVDDGPPLRPWMCSRTRRHHRQAFPIRGVPVIDAPDRLAGLAGYAATAFSMRSMAFIADGAHSSCMASVDSLMGFDPGVA